MNKFNTCISKILAESKILTNSKKFGSVFKPGDKVKITNLFNDKSESKIIKKFDGVEYQFEDGSGFHHSGFSIEPFGMITYTNGEPSLKIEKL